MNPRKRRAITRAILAGIPKSKLNSESIRKFLAREKEKGSLNLTEQCIEDILFPKGFINRPIETKKIVDKATQIKIKEVSKKIVEVIEETEVEVTEEASEFTFTIQNTKSELQKECDRRGIEYKKNFSKSKLLELIIES